MQCTYYLLYYLCLLCVLLIALSLCTIVGYVIVRPLSTVGYTSVAASVIHSRPWSN